MSASIPLSRPNVGDLEIQYVTDVLRSGMLSLGPRVPEFENRFASYVGRKHAVAVNSGTSALHLCIRAMGIGPEDEVITSSFSCTKAACRCSSTSTRKASIFLLRRYNTFSPRDAHAIPKDIASTKILAVALKRFCLSTFLVCRAIWI
ncbi:MAG: hypothetical protein DMG98_28715 [Acidobacteria bacterium]|nr:MAG: hypothetical protein DMG98_28715 [Acidobacteriota bacterium]